MELMGLSLMGIFFLPGLFFLAYIFVLILYNVLFNLVYVRFLASILGHTVNLKKMGKWAVVTGATDGIGKAYVDEFARQGIDVVLISRTQSKLDEVARSLEKFYVKTMTIVADYTKQDIYEKLREQLRDLEIGILVNNVGMSYRYPEYFLDIQNSEQAIHDLVNVNTMSSIMMTQIVLPGMVTRQRGVILNLSSSAALHPMPLLNIYSSTKASVDYFSCALMEEYRSKGIFIQSVIPFYVSTNMSKIKKTSFFVPSPTEYVREQIKTIGLEDRTFGCNSHKIMGFVLEFLVKFFPRRIVSAIFYRQMKSDNKRALKIIARNKKE